MKFFKSKTSKQALISEINELKKQNESLKNLLDISERRNITSDNSENNIDIKVLSDLKIDEMVNKLLEDENINVKYLPDFVEKAIYKNVLNLTIGLLSNMLSNAHVQVLGHQVKFELTPVPN